MASDRERAFRHFVPTALIAFVAFGVSVGTARAQGESARAQGGDAARTEGPRPASELVGLDAVVARTVRVQITRIPKAKVAGSEDSGTSAKANDPKAGPAKSSWGTSPSEPVREQVVGYILDDGERIATFGDLLEDAAMIVVETSTGELRRGKSAGRDPQSGIGLVCVDKLPVPPAPRFDSTNARACPLGTSVFVVGDPQHVGLAPTMGSLAARARQVDEAESGEAAIKRPPMLQLAIACDSGDRGGPVATADGTILGVCLGPYAASEGNPHSTLAFAVPIAEVLSVCKLLADIDREHQQIETRGHSSWPYLGVWAMDIYDPVLEAQLDLDEDQGILIQNVFPDSPAANCGLTRYDVVAKIDGKKLKGTLGLREILRECKPEQTIVLEVIRKGKRFDLPVQLKSAE